MLYSCHTKIANIHTTHKGARAARAQTTVPMGGGAGCFTLCVWCECWRSFVWHEYRIYRIYKIYRIYRVCRVFRLYRVYRVYTVYRAYRSYRIVRSYSVGTRGSQKNAFFHFRKCYLNDLFPCFGLFLGLGNPLKSSGML